MGFIFLVLTTIQTMVDNFLCNGVMMLLLLLTIVVKITRQIILLPSLWGWGFVGLCGAFFGFLPQLIIQRLSVYSQHSCSLRLIAATLL